MLKPKDWVGLDTRIECLKLAELKEYTNGNHSQEDQQEGPSLYRKMMSGMIWKKKLMKWAEQVQDRHK